MSALRDAHYAYLARRHGDTTKHRLHFSSDAWPGSCLRRAWLELTDAPRRAWSLGELSMFASGHEKERQVVASWIDQGLVLAVRTRIEPPAHLLPWWSSGEADVILRDGRVVDVKSKREHAIPAARGQFERLVTDANRWQVSAYYHGLRAAGEEISGAALYYVDREEDAAPAEVDLELSGLGIVPEDELHQELERKASAVFQDECPPPAERLEVMRVWKKKPPAAVALLNWQCRTCPFRNVSCNPGLDEEDLAVSPDELERAHAEATRRWESGSTKTPEVIDRYLRPENVLEVNHG